jgi:hypothetical protein
MVNNIRGADGAANANVARNKENRLGPKDKRRILLFCALQFAFIFCNQRLTAGTCKGGIWAGKATRRRIRYWGHFPENATEFARRF